MSYYGENNIFSFRDNFCEQLASLQITPSSLAEFAGCCEIENKRIMIGYESEKLKASAYCIAAGFSDNGNNIILTELSMLTSFRYAIKLFSADVGVFLSGEDCLKLSFFDEYGLSLLPETMHKIMSPLNQNLNKSKKRGKISSFLHIDDLYLNTIYDQIDFNNSSADISCANSSVRKMWSDIFQNDNPEFVFRVSESGENITAYSHNLGFINHERLILTYALMLLKKGETVALPQKIHFISDELAKNTSGNIVKYNDYSNANRNIAANQRFTFDPLFLCVKLMSAAEDIDSLISSVKPFYTAKREIAVSHSNIEEKFFSVPNGKINIEKSGKNRITVTAQAYCAETASELCGEWQSRLSALNVFTKNFHCDEKNY